MYEPVESGPRVTDCNSMSVVSNDIDECAYSCAIFLLAVLGSPRIAAMTGSTPKPCARTLLVLSGL
jgi:hypothetical protein